MSQEVITVNIGGIGNRIGNRLWERYYEEYEIDIYEKYRNIAENIKYNHQINNFFYENQKRIYKPRNINIDLDNDSLTTF